MSAPIIQLLLLAAVMALAVFFLSQRRKARAKAWVKMGFLAFIVASVWAVLRPDDLTVVARWVGVNRGTDLLLYALLVAFLFTTLSTYIRLREQELRYARLARAIALKDAVTPTDPLPPALAGSRGAAGAGATAGADEEGGN